MSLLRASSEAIENEVKIEQLEDGANIEHGPALVRYAESAVRQDSDLPDSRSDLLGVAGLQALVEAAATVSAFEGLNRLADVTGIQLDSGLADESADFRSELGIDAYAGAASTKSNGFAQRAGDVIGIFR